MALPLLTSESWPWATPEVSENSTPVPAIPLNLWCRHSGVAAFSLRGCSFLPFFSFSLPLPFSSTFMIALGGASLPPDPLALVFGIWAPLPIPFPNFLGRLSKWLRTPFFLSTWTRAARTSGVVVVLLWRDSTSCHLLCKWLRLPETVRGEAIHHFGHAWRGGCSAARFSRGNSRTTLGSGKLCRVRRLPNCLLHRHTKRAGLVSRQLANLSFFPKVVAFSRCRRRWSSFRFLHGTRNGRGCASLGRTSLKSDSSQTSPLHDDPLATENKH